MLVLKFNQPSYDIIPILIALTFGFSLLLSGKVHFGDIYAMFILGNLLIYFLLNFISQVNHATCRLSKFHYTVL